MELREFVGDTLKAIIDGVCDAQKTMKGHVNPAIVTTPKIQPEGIYYVAAGRTAYPVHFDVAVSITDTETGEGGGKISVLGVGAAGKLTSETERSSVTRIAFAVPVKLPYPTV